MPMEALKERIMRDGQGIGRGVLKVDSFLNHQIDVAFMDEIGRELAMRFQRLPVTKILTVESSGIPVACAVSRAMGYLPVVFAKKAAPNTMVEGVYSTDVKSFTKETVSTIRVSRKFLQPEDRILIIDDFLANGEAALGLANIVQQAGSEVVGIGIVIEKSFQPGRQRLIDAGFRVESLARVQAFKDGKVIFAE